MVFQSTLPARGATLFRALRRAHIVISIHAPRTGSDRKPPAAHQPPEISIHAPRTGSDPEKHQRRTSRRRFQSTLPARGATRKPPAAHQPPEISIHAPRTGSDTDGDAQAPPRKISIHAPRTGSDPAAHQPPEEAEISIHAPRTGSDDVAKGRKRPRKDFNPRSPHGERQRKVTILSIRIIGFAQKVYHKTVLLRISLAENAVILPEKPRNPVRTSLQKAGGLRFARAIRAARPYSISSPSGA